MLPRLFEPVRLLCALTLLSAPAMAQLSGGESKFLPGDDLIGAAAGLQDQPQVAAGGPGALAVWSDLRSEPLTTFSGNATVRDIFAVRLDPAGLPLDPTPIPISTTFGEQREPQVAWNGENWLVVWRDQSPTQSFFADGILAVRVSPDGVVLDESPLVLHAFETSSSSMFALATSGTDWMVAYQGTTSTETGIFGVRVAADGTVVDPAGVELVPGTFFLFFNLGLASAGGEYLLTYTASGAPIAKRYSSNLAALGTLNNLPAGSFASDGSQYMVTWIEGGQVRASTMSTTGVLAVPAGLALGSSASVTGSPHASWAGGQWWVYWRNVLLGPLAVRITSTGQVLDPGGIALDTPNENSIDQVDLTGRTDGGAQVVWRDRRAATFVPDDIYGQALGADGSTTVPAPISLAAPAQLFPDLTVGSGQVLTTFLDATSAGMRLMAQRIDEFGTAIDLQPIEVATGVNLSPPDAAWNGSAFLIVWADNGQTFGRRYDAAMVALDAQPIAIDAGHSPDVAAVGDDFLVVYAQFVSSIQFAFPRAKRVDGPTGAVLDATPIALGNSFARRPEVTAFGNRWLAVWQRNVSHDNPAAVVTAAFIAADGSTAGEFVVSFTGGQPTVAASDSVALVAWRTGTDSSSNPDLAFGRLALDGSLLDGTSGKNLATAPGQQVWPSATWTGSQFVVAWEDKREAASFFDQRTDVYGIRVLEDGTLVDSGGVPLHTGLDPITAPSLATIDGHSLLATADLRFDEPYQSYRAALRTIGPWEGLGGGLAGTQGLPVLDGAGALAAGSSVELRLSSARASSPGAWVLGPAAVPTPLFGGLLIPQPVIVLPLSTDALGQATIGGTLNPPILSGAQLVLQAWILDPVAVQGFAASNGLSSLAP
ncbi:hypothetical protein [Engelhardtia mirabilis]|uniref:Uncharacterized protein n=1 Tax=Engelhardtia mirabilis TaxID=2528011 RepID=A0A518BPZ7_9BACT|nr:hypothetical protein Pla133_41600 [Planctomycetes bacterium Pla133]QDV03371.1 hypothetical protein Pla86_41590 [Planctomycetes bacterium Pla86]